MFEQLAKRVEDKARAAAEATRDHSREAFAMFPDVRLRREGDMLAIEAMGLMRRWMSDSRLRFALWRKQ